MATDNDGMAAGSSSLPPSSIFSLVVVLHKHRLSLAALRKPAHVRVYVVAPPRMLYDETNVDIYYAVEQAVGEQEYTQLMQKARELASVHSTTNVRLAAFEACLQRPVAELRRELQLEGLSPEQIDLLSRIGETNGRRLGVTTPRIFCLNGPPQPDAWLDALKTQLSGYPMLARPSRTSDSRGIVGMTRLEGDDDVRHWLRRTYATSPPSAEWLVEECLQYGHEFIAFCTPSRRILYCLCSVDLNRSYFESMRDQRPYVVELLTVERMRDALPGVESFIQQTIKALFSKSFCEAVFIRGYYKSHNHIWLQGVALQPGSDSFGALLALPRASPGWEALALEALYRLDDDDCSLSADPSHHLLINFPSSEGVLLHQTMIRRNSSGVRISWRAAEGQELRNCDGIDSNVVQVFMWNTDRQQLLEEADEVQSISITLDRATIMERAAAVQRNLNRLHMREFVRSCTTTD